VLASATKTFAGQLLKGRSVKDAAVKTTLQAAKKGACCLLGWLSSAAAWR